MYKVRYIFIFIILVFYRERIIEYTLPSTDGPLIKSTVKEFVASVAARTSAPGGGSVSALVAAMVLIFLNIIFIFTYKLVGMINIDEYLFCREVP